MGSTKDETTEALRRQITQDASFLEETERAESSLVNLSFQSIVRPERHVWIDTKMGKDGQGFTVDLEDWTQDATWDNAVATIDTPAEEWIVRDLVHAWLRGDPLDLCLQLCRNCAVHRKVS